MQRTQIDAGRKPQSAVAVEDEQLFRLLALCAQRPGEPQIADRLPTALAAVSPCADLVWSSDAYGLAPLLLAHLRSARLAVPPSISVGLYARCRYHAGEAAARRRIAGTAIEALTAAGVPLLVLKGAALAQLVYADAAQRPMRDVDLLVPRAHVRRAYEILREVGFAPGERITAPSHHHLPGLWKGDDEATIGIELHHELLPATPLLAPVVYDDLIGRARAFEWSGLTLQTLGREDMLWHVYAHAFVVNTLCPGIRLISLADVIHATEAWADVLDWEALGRRYPRLLRALPLIDHLVPWSANVRRRLGVKPSRPLGGLRPLSSSLHWSAALSRDVLWHPEWWFRMRYGVDGIWRWVWYRAVGHPLRICLSAAGTSTRRLSQHLHVEGPPAVPTGSVVNSSSGGPAS